MSRRATESRSALEETNKWASSSTRPKARSKREGEVDEAKGKVKGVVEDVKQAVKDAVK
jgi:hypothetical protein